LSAIAKAHGAQYYQTLTGFKWLTNIAMEQQSEAHPFLFAYEEALGYTIWDKLETLYRQHGFYCNAQRSIALEPNSPSNGDKLRQQPPTQIAGQNVIVTEDLKYSTRFLANGSTETINLPSSDVLIYTLEDQSRVIVRPSGTEPKLKCNYEVISDFPDTMSYEEASKAAEEKMSALIAAHQQSL
jgi:phosphomannomutase